MKNKGDVSFYRQSNLYFVFADTLLYWIQFFVEPTPREPENTEQGKSYEEK